MQRSHIMYYHGRLFSLHPNMSPGLASVGKNMDSVTAFGTHHGHSEIHHRVKGGLDDKWCWASLFQKQAENQEEPTWPSWGDPWVCSLLPCAWGIFPTLAAPISSIKPQQQQKMVTFLWWVFCVCFCRFPVSYFHLPFQDSGPSL